MILPLLLMTLGCADFNLDGAKFGGPLEGEVEPGTLRLDISPSDDALGLLPQSLILAPSDYLDVEAPLANELSSTVWVEGVLTAEVLQGWTASSSASGPLAATVSAERPSLRQGGAVATDEEGTFSLALPGSQPYTLTITPAEATATPLLAFANRNVGEGVRIDEDVAPGAPLYGRVTDDNGARVGGVAMHLVRLDTGGRTSTFESDASGWYVARVEPGFAYELVVEGSTEAVGGPIPTLTLPIEVEDEEGAQLDVGVGSRRSFSVELTAADADGNRLSHPRARATSEALPLGSLQVEFEGQGDGLLNLSLPEGTWTIEVIPSDSPSDSEPTLSPFVVSGLAVTEDQKLGVVTLAAPALLQGVVRDATEEHAVAAGVAVSAVSEGFGGYTFTTITDEDGRYELSVPRTDLRVEATPGRASLGAYTREWVDVSADRETLDFDLPAGTALSGILTAEGQVVPYAQVLVYDHVAGLLLARTLSDADGHYSVNVELPETDDESDTAGDTGP